MRSSGTWGHGLVMGAELMLDWMVLKGFSNINNSMVL